MYGLWLFKELKTEYGCAKVEIYKRNYTGQAIEIEALAGNSLNISLDNLNEVTAPIGKSVCSFAIIDTDQLSYDSFFTPDATALKVVVSTKVGGGAYNTRWSGYVTPDFFAENLSYRTPINISARDNIGYLNDVDFDLTQSTITIRQLIIAAFNKIASDYPMSLVFATKKRTEMGLKVIDATISTVLLKEMTWYEAIETVLHDLGMQMRWVDNNTIAVIDISQIPEYYTSQTFNFIQSSGYREILPAWKDLQQKQNYGLRSNFFEGWLRSNNLSFSKSLRYSIPDLGFSQDVRYYTPNNWGVGREIYTTDPSFYNSTFGKKIIFSSVSQTEPNTTYLSWSTNVLSSKAPLLLKFKAMNTVLYPFGGYSPYPLQLRLYNPFLALGASEGDYLQIGIRMNLFLHTNDHKTYVMQKEWVEDNGTGGDQYINFTLDKVSLDSYQYQDGKGFFPIGNQPAEKELTITANTIPYDGVLELRIYGYYVADYHYGAENMQSPNFDKFFAYINELTYTFDNGSTISGQNALVSIDNAHNVKGSQDYQFGEVPIDSGGINTYAGGLYDSAGKEIYGFQRSESEGIYNLLELVGREIIHFNKKNYNKLSGTIQNFDKEPLSFNKLFIRDGKKYMPYSYSLDVIANKMNITTMQEVEQYTTESYTKIDSELVSGGTTIAGGDNTILQYSDDAGNAKRIYELETATEDEAQASYLLIDRAGFPAAKKYNIDSLLKLDSVLGIDENGDVFIKMKDAETPRNFYSFGEIASGGIGEPSTDDSVFNLLTSWNQDYDETYALGANLGVELKDITTQLNSRIVTLEQNPSFDANALWTELAQGWGGSAEDKIIAQDHIPVLNWDQIAFGKPNTLSGYGIVDAYTKTESDSRYLSVSGGTIRSASSMPLALDSDNTYINTLVFSLISEKVASVGWDFENGAAIYNYKCAKYLGIKNNGTAHFSGNTLLHSANYASFLNEKYLTVETDQTVKGSKTFEKSVSATSFIGSLTGTADNATKLGGQAASYYAVADNVYSKTEADAKYVTLATAQTISGAKTFSQGIKITGSSNTTNIEGYLVVDNHVTFKKTLTGTEGMTLDWYGNIWSNSVIPQTTDMFDLGLSNKKWKHAYVSDLIAITGGTTPTLQIGDALLYWDKENDCLRTNANFSSDGEMSSGGVGEEESIESGINITVLPHTGLSAYGSTEKMDEVFSAYAVKLINDTINVIKSEVNAISNSIGDEVTYIPEVTGVLTGAYLNPSGAITANKYGWSVRYYYIEQDCEINYIANKLGNIGAFISESIPQIGQTYNLLGWGNVELLQGTIFVKKGSYFCSTDLDANYVDVEIKSLELINVAEAIRDNQDSIEEVSAEVKAVAEKLKTEVTYVPSITGTLTEAYLNPDGSISANKYGWAVRYQYIEQDCKVSYKASKVGSIGAFISDSIPVIGKKYDLIGFGNTALLEGTIAVQGGSYFCSTYNTESTGNYVDITAQYTQETNYSERVGKIEAETPNFRQATMASSYFLGNRMIDTMTRTRWHNSTDTKIGNFTPVSATADTITLSAEDAACISRIVILACELNDKSCEFVYFSAASGNTITKLYDFGENVDCRNIVKMQCLHDTTEGSYGIHLSPLGYRAMAKDIYRQSYQLRQFGDIRFCGGWTAQYCQKAVDYKDSRIVDSYGNVVCQPILDGVLVGGGNICEMVYVRAIGNTINARTCYEIAQSSPNGASITFPLKAHYGFKGFVRVVCGRESDSNGLVLMSIKNNGRLVKSIDVPKVLDSFVIELNDKVYDSVEIEFSMPSAALTKFKIIEMTLHETYVVPSQYRPIDSSAVVAFLGSSNTQFPSLQVAESLCPGDAANAIVTRPDGSTGDGCGFLPKELARLSGAVVDNWGKSGEKTAYGLEKIASILQHKRYTHIVLSLFGNDLNAGIAPSAVITNIRRMCEYARGCGCIPMVMLGYGSESSSEANSYALMYDDLTQGFDSPFVYTNSALH